MTITRTSRFALKFSNLGKREQLRDFVTEYIKVVNQIIELLWQNQTFTGSFAPKDILSKVDTWISARALQAAGKQAIQAVKSQRKRRNKTMPVVKSQTVELDQRFVTFIDDDSTFDEFVKFSSLGNRLIVACPVKHHRHYNNFIKNGFKRSKSTRLTIVNGNLYLDVILDKEAKTKSVPKTIGIDMGIKKLMVDSDGNEYGRDIERLIDKANRKKFKSKAFNRALKERDCYIRRTVKELPVANLVMEDLRGLDKNTRKRLRKSFRSKVHRWTYADLMKAVMLQSEVVGVQCHFVNPSYTSQTCSKCGFVHKSNRNGEIFKCGNCDCTLDADFNASLNILNLGLTQQNMVAGNTKAGFN